MKKARILLYLGFLFVLGKINSGSRHFLLGHRLRFAV